MTNACDGSRGLDICPDTDKVLGNILPLLPRGRAWGNHDGGPGASSTIYKFWRAVASVFAFANQRICDLREEFWCATRNETDYLWLREYGLPDGCDPFPDVCVKVAAVGGATCSYLQAIAAKRGWSIACSTACGDEAGCAEAGLAVAGVYAPAGTLFIAVFASASPAYVPSVSAVEAGCVEAGQNVDCDPLAPLRCLLERIVHAHLLIFYTIIEG
jgi:hypothetical protein